MYNLKIFVTPQRDIATARLQRGNFWSAVHCIIRNAWLDRLCTSPSIEPSATR